MDDVDDDRRGGDPVEAEDGSDAEHDPDGEHHHAVPDAVVVEVGEAVDGSHPDARGHHRGQRLQPARQSARQEGRRQDTPPLVTLPITSVKIEPSRTPSRPKIAPRRDRRDTAPAGRRLRRTVPSRSRSGPRYGDQAVRGGKPPQRGAGIAGAAPFTTRAPSPAKDLAFARPLPRLAPVTTTLSSRRCRCMTPPFTASPPPGGQPE